MPNWQPPVRAVQVIILIPPRTVFGLRTNAFDYHWLLHPELLWRHIEPGVTNWTIQNALGRRQIAGKDCS